MERDEGEMGQREQPLYGAYTFNVSTQEAEKLGL